MHARAYALRLCRVADVHKSRWLRRQCLHSTCAAPCCALQTKCCSRGLGQSIDTLHKGNLKLPLLHDCLCSHTHLYKTRTIRPELLCWHIRRAIRVGWRKPHLRSLRPPIDEECHAHTIIDAIEDTVPKAAIKHQEVALVREYQRALCWVLW
jgi:hypothetical protein